SGSFASYQQASTRIISQNFAKCRDQKIKPLLSRQTAHTENDWIVLLKEVMNIFRKITPRSRHNFVDRNSIPDDGDPLGPSQITWKFLCHCFSNQNDFLHSRDGQPIKYLIHPHASESWRVHIPMQCCYNGNGLSKPPEKAHKNIEFVSV